MVNKLQKNIQQLVAKKVLKDIRKIVDEETLKEKSEKYWAILGLVLIFSAVLLLLAFLNRT